MAIGNGANEKKLYIFEYSGAVVPNLSVFWHILDVKLNSLIVHLQVFFYHCQEIVDVFNKFEISPHHLFSHTTK